MVTYHTLKFKIKFEHPIRFTNLPAFYFRSILGNELHRMVCIFKRRPCSSCVLRFQCAYSYLFESPIAHENTILTGRNFASHPFVIFTDFKPEFSVNELDLFLTLIGESKKYLPLIYLAIQNGGEHGIFKSRVKYEIKEFYIDDFIGVNNQRQIIIPSETKIWTMTNESMKVKNGKIFIELISPFRYKKEGHLTDKINLYDLLLAIKRRIEILYCFYMEPQKILPIEFGNYEIKNSNNQLQWTDYFRYSARQKHAMRMGGIKGIMSVEGRFNENILHLLKGAEIFHIGKNTSFGLGKIKVTFIERNNL